MLVIYQTCHDVLLMRPQTAVPRVGDHVVLTPEGGTERRYHVVAVTWPVRVKPQQWYSLIDEADVQVQVTLELGEPSVQEDVG